MIRKVLWATALALAGLGVAAGFSVRGGAAAEPEKPGAGKTAPFVHCVILHLKKDAPADEGDLLIADAHDMLSAIPSVRDLRVGKPVVKEKPDKAKTDYQVGLLVLFDDVEGLNIYLNHPRHLKYVEKHGKYLDMEKLGVYDFLDQKK